jgi:hypothetical protein
MFIVHIKNNKTGEIRKHMEDSDWEEGGAFHWGPDGNYGCDCNRALFFARAGNEEDTEAWGHPCGDHVAFTAEVELPDGTRIKVDET